MIINIMVMENYIMKILIFYYMKENLYLIYLKVKVFYTRILIKNMKENLLKDFLMVRLSIMN